MTSLKYFSNIEENYFFGFKKKILFVMKQFEYIGFNTSYENFSDVTLLGFFKFIYKIFQCKSERIIIRAVGLRTIVLMLFIPFIRLNKKIYLEVPTPFSTVLNEFRINNNKKISDYIYLILLIFLGPIFLTFFNYILEYDEERFPFNLFIHKKLILCDNGYDVTNIDYKRKKLEILNRKIKLVCVGSIAPWHGIERIIDSIYAYNNKFNNHIKFDINIIGFIEKDYKIKLLKHFSKIKKYNSIIFHGLLDGDKLFNEYMKAHIGIGSLGLSKIKRMNRSELKIREFCSVGIPFIMEAKDRDFLNKCDFIYKLKNNSYLIDFENVIKWYQKLPINISLKMRKFANANLDYKNKIDKISIYFK